MGPIERIEAVIGEPVEFEPAAEPVPWLAPRGVCPCCDRRRDDGAARVRAHRERKRDT